MTKKLYKNINFNAKVKCILCGKVGLASDKAGLTRHAKLAHEKSDIESMFIPTDEDVPIEIIATTKKDFRKILKRVSNKPLKKEQAKKKKTLRNKTKRKSLYWGAVIKTAFETKR